MHACNLCGPEFNTYVQPTPTSALILLRNWSYITEERDIADIRMQNKQMTICENISGSAGIAH